MTAESLHGIPTDDFFHRFHEKVCDIAEAIGYRPTHDLNLYIGEVENRIANMEAERNELKDEIERYKIVFDKLLEITPLSTEQLEFLESLNSLAKWAHQQAQKE